MGGDPYGFLGKFQALTCNWETAPRGIARLLIKQPRMLDSYIDAVVSCGDWNGGNTLAALLPEIDHLRDSQVDRLIRAYRENFEVNGSFGFNGTNPGSYGPGLAWHLKRITGKDCDLSTH